MTDTTATDRTDEARRAHPALDKARLRRRYAAERRFRAYGLIAIGAAVAMLAILLITIIAKGLSAFWLHEMTVEVDLSREALGIESTEPDALKAANYRGAVRDSVRATFPYVDGRRPERRLLALISVGAELQVRNAVLEDPSLVGGPRRFAVKLSDDADIFLKGQMTDWHSVSPKGTATPVQTDDEESLRIVSSADDFAPLLDRVKDHLAARAQKRRDDAAGTERSLRQAEAQLEALRADESQSVAAGNTVEELEREVERLKAEIAEDRAAAADLQARAEAAGGVETLDENVPTYFIHINGGIVEAGDVGTNTLTGEVIKPLDGMDEAAPGAWSIQVLETPEDSRRLKDKEAAWLFDAQDRGLVENTFNTTFFTAGDSREPEMAGIWGAAVGSFLTLIVTMLLSVPVGILAAVYLEEFAPKNRFTDLIEVNINNLAAVPSIVFGLLGLAVFLNFFGLPRSAPLVGGMVLALMTLPTVIIASRAALKAVPPSIREAALGVGASPLQVVTHHVLPLAMPGILTGTIIGMAQALGETAPLLMIGMVAFIVDVPGGFTDPATVLPVQIFLWADSPERAFVAKTSAAIMVLLAFLICMNALAVFLRKRFERRW